MIQSRKDAGEVCCACTETLDPPKQPGFRTCPACSRKTKRIYLEFHESSRWVSTFLEENLQVAVGNRTFKTDPEKLRELLKNYGESKVLEDINILESAIRSHRGGFWLKLPLVHYERLKRG